MGPVQVLVVGFERPAFSGEVLAELARLRESGIVRLVDLLLVARAADGTFETIAAPAGAAADQGALVAALLGQPEARGDDDATTADTATSDLATWSLADSVPVGTTAAVALIEHMWAAPLSEAIRRTGGVPLEETWLTGGDIQALETLIAQRAG